MKGARTKKSIYNMLAFIVYSFIVLIFRFIIRRLFLISFGATVLGYYTTFNSMVGMLNLAELGIGTAITFNLYKPVAENDYNKVNAYLGIYKKLYFIIGGFIFFSGIAVIPLLPSIVREEQSQVVYLGIIFLLQLMITVSSYWFAYKRIIYTVYQDSYLIYAMDSTCFIFFNIVQIIVLLALQNYYLYLLVEIVNVLVSNVLLSLMCQKKYPFVKLERKSILRDNIIRISDFTKDIKNVIISKFGGYILNSTDAVVVSTIMGATATGYMTNYTTIFTSFQTTVLGLLTVIQPSLGNKIYTDGDKKSIEDAIIHISFLSQLIGSTFSITAFFIVDIFITIWIGSSYILDIRTVFFFALNVYIYILMYPISLLFATLGYFKYDKVIIMIAAMINIFISIFLVKHYGVLGVLIGTAIALIIYWVCRTIILYKKFYLFKADNYIKEIIRCLATTIIAGCAIAVLNNLLNLNCSYFLQFIIKGTVYVIVILLVNSIIFIRSSSFKYASNILLKALKKMGWEKIK